MKRTCLRWIATASAALLALAALEAARRPRYGGELRLQIRASVKSPDPAEWPADPEEAAAKSALLGQVFETLVRIDEHGEVQPWLATAWTHDAAHKRWLFTPRPNVQLQDGTKWEPAGGAVAVADDKPIEQILRDLARVRNAVVVRAADGTLEGTGPFRIAAWGPGKSVRLEANAGYWRGRPYLDAVNVQMGRTLRDQSLAFELGQTDVAEASIADLRSLGQRGVGIQVSKPAETLALVFPGEKVAAGVRQRLALAIDRVTIQRVLLDRQGEISGALVPQWLSGYAFLFPAARDLERARTLPALRRRSNSAMIAETSWYARWPNGSPSTPARRASRCARPAAQPMYNW